MTRAESNERNGQMGKRVALENSRFIFEQQMNL